MTLKKKILAVITLILACCIGVYVVLDMQIKKTRAQVDDKMIVNIYDNVRLSNEGFHVKNVGEHLQKLTQQDAVLEIIAGEDIANNALIIKGMYLSLESKVHIARLVVMDTAFNVLVNEANKNAASCPKALFQSDMIKELCGIVGETWNDEGRMICLDGIPAFLIVSAVINDDDEAVGFVLGFMPAAIMAETMAKSVDAHVIYQRISGEYAAASDPDFLAALSPDCKGIPSGTGTVITTKQGAFLTYAIPITYGKQKPMGGRYWVCREYTESHKLTRNLNKLRFGLITAVILAAIGLSFFLLTRLLAPPDDGKRCPQ